MTDAEQPAGPFYAIFTAEINAVTADALIAVMSEAANRGHREIHLGFASPGGEINSGLAVYHALRALPIDLSIYNIGYIASMGNIIFLAGKHRFADEHTQFMFHGVSFGLPGSTQVNEGMLRDWVEGLDAHRAQLSSLVESQTSITGSELERIFDKQTTVTSAKAVEWGLVEEIRSFDVPDGCTVFHFTFDRN